MLNYFIINKVELFADLSECNLFDKLGKMQHRLEIKITGLHRELILRYKRFQKASK